VENAEIITLPFYVYFLYIWQKRIDITASRGNVNRIEI